MSCHQTKKSLSGFLDDRLSPEAVEEVTAHLADCPACRAELADLRRIDELLAGFADPPVDEQRLASLWSRVESQLQAAPADEDPDAAAALAGGAPIVMTPQPARQPRWIVPTLAAAGVAIVAVFVIALILVIEPGRRTDPKERHASSVTPAMASDTGAMSGAAMTAAAMTAMDADAMGADAMTAAGSDMGSDAMTAMAPDPMRHRRRRRGAYAVSRGMSGTTRRTMSTGGSASSMSSSGGSSLQDLLRRAGGAMGSSGASSSSNLSQRLSPSQIRKGVYSILGSARACFNRYRVPGRLQVHVVVSGGTGRVSSATVRGKLKGTPTARCVARAFRRARFPRFRAGTQSFTFPLVFR